MKCAVIPVHSPWHHSAAHSMHKCPLLTVQSVARMHAMLHPSSDRQRVGLQAASFRPARIRCGTATCAASAAAAPRAASRTASTCCTAGAGTRPLCTCPTAPASLWAPAPASAWLFCRCTAARLPLAREDEVLVCKSQLHGSLRPHLCCWRRSGMAAAIYTSIDGVASSRCTHVH